MGVIGRPHGVRGLCHVHSYTADPADLARYAPLQDGKGGVWTLAWHSEGVARLTDATGRAVADREAAEKLVNLRLYVERDRLPPAEDDEFYVADLVGLAVTDAAGLALGSVIATHDHGAGTYLEIAAENASPVLVPFTRVCVPVVDMAARCLVVALPADIVVSPEAAAQDSHAADGPSSEGWAA